MMPDQRCSSGGDEEAVMYLATLNCATSNPSLSSSPWMRGAPQRDAHLPYQRTQPGLDRRPASQRSRLPAPIAAKARVVPVDERLGTDDGKYLKDRRKPAVKQDQDSAILFRKPDATLEPAPQSTAFSASSFIFDLIGAAKTARTKHRSSIIPPA